MNRPTFLRPQLSAAAPMASWGSGFPVVARLRRELFKEFVRSAWPASRDGVLVEPRARHPQSNLSLSHPASSLPPLPGSHAAGLSSPQGRPHLFATATRLLLAALALLAVYAPVPAAARANFDCNWNVLIVTSSGPCDLSLRSVHS